MKIEKIVFEGSKQLGRETKLALEKISEYHWEKILYNKDLHPLALGLSFTGNIFSPEPKEILE